MQEAGLPASDHMPTPAEVDQIAALADPVIRNLQITQSYHELALAMIARTGICANWCTFATWASKQAGQTIRKEDLARLIDEAQLSAPPSAQAVETVTLSAQSLGSDRSQAEIQEAVALALNPLTALDRASDAVGRGNQKVYAEIGREFARFFEACLHDPHFDADNVTLFCETLRHGDPPAGQRYLRQAFARYDQAFFETDPK
ncbi:MAG: hypothetical protein K8L99_15635, partial [Anaerolineae bacterium]|nr:hypothetical protein [Anaerolineae bacterium]